MDEGAAIWPLSLRLIHWVSAALVLGALGCGVYMAQLIDDPAERFELTQTHKSIGIALLALTLARLCLRILATVPKPEPAAPLLLAAAKTAHFTLYALLVGMPLSGWLMATTTPVRVPTFVFGLFELPYLLPPALPTYQFAHAIHVTFAIALAFLIAVHVAAALVHAILWRDHTFARIWRTQRSAGVEFSADAAAASRGPRRERAPICEYPRWTAPIRARYRRSLWPDKPSER